MKKKNLTTANESDNSNIIWNTAKMDVDDGGIPKGTVVSMVVSKKGVKIIGVNPEKYTKHVMKDFDGIDKDPEAAIYWVEMTMPMGKPSPDGNKYFRIIIK